MPAAEREDIHISQCLIHLVQHLLFPRTSRLLVTFDNED